MAVENALEPYHIGIVHPTSLETLQLEAGVNEYHGQNSILYAPVGNARVNRQQRMLKKQFAIDYACEGYMSVYLFPFTMISLTHGHSYSLQHFFPLARDQDSCHFSSRLLLTHAAGGNVHKILAPLFASTAQVNRKVFAEDHEVCKLVPRASWSMAPLRYASVAEDKIGRFRGGLPGVSRAEIWGYEFAYLSSHKIHGVVHRRRRRISGHKFTTRLI